MSCLQKTLVVALFMREDPEKCRTALPEGDTPAYCRAFFPQFEDGQHLA